MSSRRKGANRLPRVYIYVLKYDLGFAPNPFDGVCTFACCKPVIRRTAQVGDWLVGVGGRSLRATGRCIFAMEVTGAMTFDEYWASPLYRSKRPSRNGTRKSLVGDNIYWRDARGEWRQENSVHSRPDGRQDADNTSHDTSEDRILTSQRFIYFGRSAPAVPTAIFAELGYRNGRGHMGYDLSMCSALLAWIAGQADGAMNRVVDKPFQYEAGNKRYSKRDDRLI